MVVVAMSASHLFGRLWLNALYALSCTKVLPYSWHPYGNEKRLYDGISDFYNKSSGIWEQVWGEHMHSGHYGVDGAAVDKDPQQAQHDMMEELLRFSGIDTKSKRSRVKSIIDIGCGIGISYQQPCLVSEQ